MYTPTNPVPPEPRRFVLWLSRPLWIGLTALALAFTTAGIGVGMPIYRQQRVVRDVRRLGGTVHWEPGGLALLPPSDGTLSHFRVKAVPADGATN